MDPRPQLLAAARALKKTPFENGAAFPSGENAPSALDCSGLVRWICLKVFPDDGRLTNGRFPTIQARTMFTSLREVRNPKPADLAFYSLLGTQGDPSHVMVVTEHRGLIGACPVAGIVKEYKTLDYLPSHWIFRGYRGFPLEP
jgi:hypothetical protein